MKNIKRILSVILCSALLITGVPNNVQAATKPSVTKKLTITVGSKKTIKVKGKYIKSKKFKTNKKSVATVNKKGKVTGKKAGKAKITVTVKYKKTKKAKKYTTKKYTCTVTVKDKKPVITKKPQETKVPVVTNKPVTTPAITITPQETKEPVVTPDTTEEPSETDTPTVTNNPVVTPEETDEPVNPSVTDAPIPTDDVIVSEEPENTDTPVITPIVTDEPVITDNPVVTDTPNVTDEPIVEPTPEPVKYDYIFMNGTRERGVIWVQYPSTTQEGIYEWYDTQTNKLKTTQNVPVLDGYETIDGVEYGIVISEEAKCISAGYKQYYDMNTGLFTDLQEIPATGHTSDEIWHTDGSEIWNECVSCSNKLNRIAVYNKGETTSYSKWITEPSETGGGVLGVYKGVNVYDMTEEEIEAEYEKYEVTFTDGREDTFYGKMDYYEDGSIRRFELYAKSTSRLVGTIEYPSYEVVEIDLGNGETTKVYGYYDREISDEMYTLLNEYRAENGLNELIKTDSMQALADKRAAEGFYTEIEYNLNNTENLYESIHIRPDYSSCSTVYGYDNPLSGENGTYTTLLTGIQASGITQAIDLTAEYEMDAFKSSEAHDYNLLYENYTHVGMSTFIGYPQNPDGTFKSYKVAVTMQVFDYKSTVEE